MSSTNAPVKPPPVIERQSSDSREIPSRTVVLKDPSELPSCYSTTPGGTLYSTTPGGTRIIYERKFLLQLRNSPLSRTPPCKLPTIPDIIAEGTVTVPTGAKSPDHTHATDHTEDAFEMEIET